MDSGDIDDNRPRESAEALVNNSEDPSGSKSKRRRMKNQSKSKTCKICGQVFNRPSKLILHMQRHNKQRLFKCHLCSKGFYRPDHLKDHIKRHADAGKYPCDQCNKCFKRADQLQCHKVNEHGKTILLNEIKTYTKIKTINTNKKNVKCTVCGKILSCERSLKSHIKIHLDLPSKKFECQHCGKSFNQRSYLAIHVRQHTGIKPYKCEICEEHFTTSSRLKTHARKHTGELPFVCESCGKCFGEFHHLKMHKRIHENLKSFVCSYCGRAFTHGSTLRSHIRTHTGAKPFKCDVCQQSFAQISSLVYHKRTHTGEKRYQCDICGNRYTRQTTLNTHRSQHTGKNLFSCSQCDFKCDIAIQLRKHIASHHKVKNVPRIPVQTKTNLVENNSGVNRNPAKPLGNAFEHLHAYSSGLSMIPSNSEVSHFSAKIGQHHITDTQKIMSVSEPWNSASDSESFRGQNLNLCINSGSNFVQNNQNLSESWPINSSSNCFPTLNFISSGSKDKEFTNGGTNQNTVESMNSFPSLPLNKSQTFSQEIFSHLNYPLDFSRGQDNNSDQMLPHRAAKDSNLPNLSNLDIKMFASPGSLSESRSVPKSTPEYMYSSTPSVLQSSTIGSNQDDPLTVTPAFKEAQGRNDILSSSSSSSFQNIASKNSNQNENYQITSEVGSRMKLKNNDLNMIESDSDSLLTSLQMPNANTNIVEAEELSEENDHSLEDNDLNETTTMVLSITMDTNKILKENKSSVLSAQNLQKEDLSSGHKGKTEMISKLNKTSDVKESDAKDISNDTNIIDTNIKGNKKEISCYICKQTFVLKRKFIQHMQLHTGRKPFQCSVCGREFSRSDHLADHMFIHSRSKELKCYHCCKELPNRKQLERHIHKLHNGVYPYGCNDCSFSCLEKLQLKVHVEQVHSYPNFSCSVCRSTFKTSKIRNEHCMRDHPEERIHKCKECDKTFTQNSGFDMHINVVHIKKKYFACGLCSETFFLPADLHRHLKAHINDQHYSCDLCSKHFLNHKLLRRHKSSCRKKISKKNAKNQQDEFTVKLPNDQIKEEEDSDFSDNSKYATEKAVPNIKGKDKALTENKGETIHEQIPCQPPEDSKNQDNFVKSDKKTIGSIKENRSREGTSSNLLRESLVLKSEVLSDKDGMSDNEDAEEFKDSEDIFLERRKTEAFSCDCYICGQTFNRNKDLLTHMSSLHAGRKPFKCSECDREFTRSDHLNDHMLIHSRSKELKCYHCGMDYTNLKQLEEHIHKNHDGNFPFKCNVCNYSCSEKFQIRVHVDQTHFQSKLSCSVCGLTFETCQMRNDHMKDHPGKRDYTCNHCGKAYSKAASLNTHLKRKHSEGKFFACGVCSEAFIAAADLHRHLRVHINDYQFACDLCGKVFMEGKLLRRHKKVHSDQKPYQCSHCGRCFKHNNTLRAHVRTHTGARPFKCDVCGDAFAQRSSLIYHRRIHTGENKYTCHICGKSVTRMTTLNDHLLSHAGRRRLSCSKCDYQSNKQVALKKHMLKCH